jgi:hypothetical protein
MTNSLTLKDVARRLVLRLIKAEVGNSTEQKARIMIALEHGHINAREAEDWIAVLELKAA